MVEMTNAIIQKIRSIQGRDVSPIYCWTCASVHEWLETENNYMKEEEDESVEDESKDCLKWSGNFVQCYKIIASVETEILLYFKRRRADVVLNSVAYF